MNISNTLQKVVVDRAGFDYVNRSNCLPWRTAHFPVTESCGVPAQLANLKNGPTGDANTKPGLTTKPMLEASMATRELPSPELLRNLLDYDPDTGVLRWRVRRSPKAAPGSIAGAPARHGYWKLGICRAYHQSHRVIWAIVHGEWPAGQIDHINGVRDDNRIANLRDVTLQENTRNRRMSSNNVSGVTGVTFHKRCQKWRVDIGVGGGVHKYVGQFADLNDAIAARRAAEAELGYTERHGKPPITAHLAQGETGDE